jgi:alpha-amylase
MSTPVDFAFALHDHQPVGNFDHVFREHVDEVYRPFLEITAAAGFRPISLHVSGPLLDWLEANDRALLDLIGREVADGRIEPLGSGRTEPILAALPRPDRIEQIERMSERVAELLGRVPKGLWLTERVWEQDLAADISEAGIEYLLLDDRHFLSAGMSREELDRPYRTESDGRSADVLPIDERLRYLIPFERVEEIESFFRHRQADGTRAIVLGDDGEKFGGWPGTRRWVYERGWLDRFLRMVDDLRQAGVVDLITTGRAAQGDSGGLVYPTPGSYREMEGWTLPRPAALRLEALRGDPGLESHPSVRGGHWKNFQRRYPVSNLMHKTALHLSGLCRERGDPPAARSAVERAQCNDAYWHGVFGGVYLPHLRQAIWRELASAEATLRADDALSAEAFDFDFDGHDEIVITGGSCSVVISPSRGGAIESLLRLDAGENDLDMLGRHFEAYHGDPGSAPPWSAVRDLWAAARLAEDDEDAGHASIHDREPLERPAPPAIDAHPPAIFREWILPGDADPGRSPSAPPLAYEVTDIEVTDESVVLSMIGRTGLTKRIEVLRDGEVRMSLEWDAAAIDGSVWTEVWLAHGRSLRPSEPFRKVHEDVVTLARSERGYEEVRQGEIVRFGWPASALRATLVIGPWQQFLAGG